MKGAGWGYEPCICIEENCVGAGGDMNNLSSRRDATSDDDAGSADQRRAGDGHVVLDLARVEADLARARPLFAVWTPCTVMIS